MIRQMRHGEEDKVRVLLAKLDFEEQSFWRKQPKTLEQCLEESSRIRISEEIEAKNVIFVAEEDNKLVGLCWCTIVDRGADEQAEIAKLFIEKEYRGKGIGKQLMNAAEQLFIKEKVEVAFIWAHPGNEEAIKLYKSAGFKQVGQLEFYLVLSTENRT